MQKEKPFYVVSDFNSLGNKTFFTESLDEAKEAKARFGDNVEIYKTTYSNVEKALEFFYSKLAPASKKFFDDLKVVLEKKGERL